MPDRQPQTPFTDGPLKKGLTHAAQQPAMKAVLALSIALGVSGCGQNWFATRATNPVIQENIGPRASRGPLTTVSTTASHRTAYMRLGGGQPGTSTVTQDNPTRWVGKAGQICPEPPPDVAQAIADRLGAAVTTQGTGVAFDRALATSVAPLIRRSQGLQYHRDQIFYLCVAYMNDLVDKENFLEKWEDIQIRSSDIIKTEIKEIGISTVTLPNGTTATVPTSAVPEIVAAQVSGFRASGDAPARSRGSAATPTPPAGGQ